ncbi:Uma2 family endonuclease [Nonomuraea sp. NPDC050310]|uniref:Uma2 family endonuclease n=1 Tax=unclassified Nonomuraea TaxID=2593643 RepID=UPI0033D7A9A0
MTIADVSPHRVQLPDTAFQMWLSGELDAYLHIPDDGSRVEIIDGKIIVSPAPRFRHGGILQQLSNLLDRELVKDPGYRWRCVQNNSLAFMAEENGYIPDLVVMDVDLYEDAWNANLRHLVPDQVELVVEVTSPSTAVQDRPPTGKTSGRGKWCGYARAEIPYYLLIDLDPKVAQVTLHSIPDAAAGAYLHTEAWKLGETVVLPDPIGVSVPTGSWQVWSEE